MAVLKKRPMHSEGHTVQHPHGNHNQLGGNRPGRLFQQDPGGFTPEMSNAGSFPGGPSGAGEANPSAGYGPGDNAGSR